MRRHFIYKSSCYIAVFFLSQQLTHAMSLPVFSHSSLSHAISLPVFSHSS